MDLAQVNDMSDTEIVSFQVLTPPLNEISSNAPFHPSCDLY